MLDATRIKEAKSGVKSYLEDGLLKKIMGNKPVQDLLFRNAKESLGVAEEINQRKLSDLWVIVCSYYAMFYGAQAVLLKMGYKVGEQIVHKVTADALIVFVRGKLHASFLDGYEEVKEEALHLAALKTDALLESFEFERNKRSVVQYKTLDVEKHSKAETSLQRAKEFTKAMEQLLIG